MMLGWRQRRMRWMKLTLRSTIWRVAWSEWTPFGNMKINSKTRRENEPWKGETGPNWRRTTTRSVWEGETKSNGRTDYNQLPKNTQTQNPIFFFPVGGASSQCKVGRKKLMKEKKNKQKHILSFFLSLSRYIGGSLILLYCLCVLHSWGWWWWGLGYCRPGGFIRDNTNTHATHSRTCERHPLSNSIFVVISLCVCVLFALSLVLFPLLHADCARSP